MPSMTSQKLSDLEAERKSFLLYERRIIQERADILNNVRIHLDQLDTEIVRLGGTARDQGGQSPSFPSITSTSDGCSSLFSSGDTDGCERPFSSMLKSDESHSQPRGGPTKLVNGAAGPGTTVSLLLPTGDNGCNQMEDTSPEKENLSSNDTSPSYSSSSDDLNKERSISFENSTRSVNIGQSSTVVKVRMTDKQSKKKLKSNSVASSETNFGEPWACECGVQMAAGRARCGKCRRWKGGKRLVRWSIKPKNSTVTIAGTVASPSSSLPGQRKSNHGKNITGVPKAIDVYRNLRVVELDSVTDGALGAGNCEQDLEVQALVQQMVLAVVNAVDLGQAKETKGPRNRRKTSGEMAAASKKKEDKSPTPNDGDKMAASKRKRGRPKKIQRVITTIDSVNVSEAPRKRDRPRKSPVVNKDAEHGEQDAGGTFKHPLLDGEETTMVAAEAVRCQLSPAMSLL